MGELVLGKLWQPVLLAKVLQVPAPAPHLQMAVLPQARASMQEATLWWSVQNLTGRKASAPSSLRGPAALHLALQTLHHLHRLHLHHHKMDPRAAAVPVQVWTSTSEYIFIV